MLIASGALPDEVQTLYDNGLSEPVWALLQLFWSNAPPQRPTAEEVRTILHVELEVVERAKVRAILIDLSSASEAHLTSRKRSD